MKRIISSVLVVLLLLNVMGFYGIFVGLSHSHSKQLSLKLDNDQYQESETITLRIPMAIPYYTNTPFERIDGEIEYQQEFYRLIKQKFENDTIHIVCIRDAGGKHIRQALSDYVKTFTDHANQESKSKITTTYAKEYFGASCLSNVSSDGWSSTLSFARVECLVFTPNISFPTPPPRT